MTDDCNHDWRETMPPDGMKRCGRCGLAVPLPGVPQTPNLKTYLGDSVYADSDGFAIVLTTENSLSTDPSNRIVLEPSVLEALERFKIIIRSGKPADAADAVWPDKFSGVHTMIDRGADGVEVIPAAPSKTGDKPDPDVLLDKVSRVKKILEAADYGLPSWHQILHKTMQELVKYYMTGKTP